MLDTRSDKEERDRPGPADARTGQADEADAHADLLAEVRGLVPAIARDAADVEVNGAVDVGVLGRLDEAGCSGCCGRGARRPRGRAGGVLRGHAAAVARSSATGWVASLFGAHSGTCRCSTNAPRRTWAGGEADPVRLVVHPRRPADPERGGGYRLSGRWSTATGLHHATGCSSARCCWTTAANRSTTSRRWYRRRSTPSRRAGPDRSARGGRRRWCSPTSGSRTPDLRLAERTRNRTLRRPRAHDGVPDALRHDPHAAVTVPLIGAAEGAYAALVAERPEAAEVPAVARALADVHAAWLR